MSAVDTDLIDPPPPPSSPRRRRRWVRRVLLLLLVLLAVLGLGAWYFLGTTAGARLVVEQATGFAGEGVKVQGVEGRLFGGLRIQRIEVDRPDMYIVIHDVDFDTAPPLFGRVDVRKLAIRSIEVRTVSTGAAAKIPVSFKPPHPVRVEELRIGELRLGELVRGAPRDANRAKDVVVRDLFVKGGGDERHWNLEEASAVTAYGRARLAGSLGTTAPFELQAKGDFSGRFSDRDVNVSLVAKGQLTGFVADARGDIGGTPATVRATLEPFATVPVRELDVEARGLDVRQLAPDAPSTKLDVEAKLTAEGKGFAGPVRVTNANPGPIDRQRLPVTAATARVRVVPERVEVADARVELVGGGSATGRAVVERGRVQADLQLAGANLAALHTQLQPTRLTGALKVSSTAEGQRFEGALADPRFQVEGRAGISSNLATIDTVRVKHRGGSLIASGTVGLKGQREFRLEGRAEHFDPAAIMKTAPGDLNFAFTTRGTLEGGPAGEAKIDLAASRYAGLPALGRLHLAGDAKRVREADVDVTLGEARLVAKGAFGRAGDAMDFSLAAPDLAVLAKPLGIAMAGRADARGRVTGTFGAPAGRIELTGANLVLPSNVYVRELALRAEAGVDPSSRIEAKLDARGVAIGTERPPTPLAETFSATMAGTRAAHRVTLDALLAKDQRLAAALEGGIDARAKALAWSGQLQSVALTGPAAFTLLAPAPLALAADRVELGDARLKGEWGEARLAVTRWTPRSLELRGSSPGLAVRNTARALRLPLARHATDLVVAADWDIRAGDQFEGTASVRRVSGDLRIGEPAVALGLQEMVVKLDAARGKARAVLDIRADRIGRVQGEGTGELVRGKSGWEFSEAAPVQARLEADVPNLEPLSAWLGADARLGGSLRANLAVSGTGRDPRFAGEVRAEGLKVREPSQGFEIDQGQMVLAIRDRTISIERFSATTPWNPSEGARKKLGGAARHDPGEITAEGSVDLRNRTGALRVRANAVPVTQLATRFVAISGEARLEAKDQGVVVTGDLKSDAAWIGALATALPTVSDDVVVVRRAAVAADDDEPKGKEKIRLDVRFGLGDNAWFQGRGLDTRLTGNLRLVGEAGALRATGSIRTVDGTYDGYGQKLAIERGSFTFSGPLENPTLNVLALRTGLPVEAGVEVYGTATRPRVRLVSRPDVPEPEKLSWLVLGRGQAESNQADAATLMAAARALLGSSAPGGDFTKRFGFDEVRIGRPDSASALGTLPQSTVAGKTGSASAADVVTVGKRLTTDVHVIYEQGLADAEGALRVTWQITKKFQLLVRAGYLPGVDAVYRWSFY